jgi:hypothetical protein
MALLKQVVLSVLGLSILVGGIFLWLRLSEWITGFSNRLGAIMRPRDVCRFRATWYVVIWTVVALSIIVPFGVLLETVGLQVFGVVDRSLSKTDLDGRGRRGDDRQLACAVQTTNGQLALIMAGGFQAPSPAGRIEGGVGFGQYNRMTR